MSSPKIFFCSILTSYFCGIFALLSSCEFKQHWIIRGKLRTNFKHYIQLVFRKPKWNEEHSIWIPFCIPLHIIHSFAMIIYYCVKYHCKIYWFKIATILLPLMILWVDWALLGSSFAPGDLGCGYCHLGPQLVCSVQAGSHARLMPQLACLKDWCFPSIFSLSWDSQVAGPLSLSTSSQGLSCSPCGFCSRTSMKTQSSQKHKSRNFQAFFRLRHGTSTFYWLKQSINRASPDFTWKGVKTRRRDSSGTIFGA